MRFLGWGNNPSPPARDLGSTLGFYSRVQGQSPMDFGAFWNLKSRQTGHMMVFHTALETNPEIVALHPGPGDKRLKPGDFGSNLAIILIKKMMIIINYY